MPPDRHPFHLPALPRLHCKRCGGKWIPRKDKTLPQKCPKCSSPYWNKARVKKRRMAA